MLDTDGDGNVREEDLLSLAAKLSEAFAANAPGTVAHLQNTFAALWETDLKKMDSDHNGTIDRDEWRAGIRHAVATDRDGFLDRMGAMVQAWLDMCDTDGDGNISRDEYITMYAKTLGLSPEHLDEAFTALDTNGSGTLSRAEIRTAVEEYYTSEENDTPGNRLFGPL
jgi:Ca2+-binding EF-hand superfamily protein